MKGYWKIEVIFQEAKTVGSIELDNLQIQEALNRQTLFSLMRI